MSTNTQINMAIRVAGWGGESGMIVTMVCLLPGLALGMFLQEDIGVVAMLAAYGLLFGFYLGRRLPSAGIAGPEHLPLLRFAPAAALVAGYAVTRVAMGALGTESPTALHGVMFGAVAGLGLGLVMLRLKLRDLQGAPLPPVAMVLGTMLVSGAIMGVVAAFIMSFALGWLFAMPAWLLGMGGAVGWFLAAPAD